MSFPTTPKTGTPAGVRAAVSSPHARLPLTAGSDEVFVSNDEK